MKIHAALMTQNELFDLARNITGLLPYVDTVTIVDGGSQDGTIPYFRNWARLNDKIRFFIHPWKDNFPAQRNNYLLRVGEIAVPGDWVLALDPDEFIEEKALAELQNLIRIVPNKPEHFRSIGFRCRSVSYRGPERVWESLDDYWKAFLFRWNPKLRYVHHGDGPVHEALPGVQPMYATGHHPEFPALIYTHEKQENIIHPRGVRNYFIGGGGMNLWHKNPRWTELRKLTDQLGITTWHQMQAYLIAGNINADLKDWIIKYRHETGWDGSSEQREWHKTYFRLYHPEEEPAELRDEHIE